MQSGPCIVCGDVNYPLSMGGPSICPSCDCGRPPALTRHRREAEELRSRCRQFEARLMSHGDFKVLQELWAELGIPGLILFDGTYPNARTTAGAKEGSGH